MDKEKECGCNSCSCENVTKIPEYSEKIVREITEEEVMFVSKYNYELQGLFQALTHFTNKQEFDINEDRYNKMLDDYIEAYAKFNIALDEVTNNNIKKDEICNKIIVYKTIDFGTRQLIVLTK